MCIYPLPPCFFCKQSKQPLRLSDRYRAFLKVLYQTYQTVGFNFLRFCGLERGGVPHAPFSHPGHPCQLVSQHRNFQGSVMES